jgi:hypothetical protein
MVGKSATHLIQGDQKFSVHLMITTKKEDASTVKSVPHQSPDIY